jgi:hypothetical protein
LCLGQLRFGALESCVDFRFLFLRARSRGCGIGCRQSFRGFGGFAFGIRLSGGGRLASCRSCRQVIVGQGASRLGRVFLSFASAARRIGYGSIVALRLGEGPAGA